MEYVIGDSNGEGVGRVRQSIKPVLPGSGLFLSDLCDCHSKDDLNQPTMLTYMKPVLNDAVTSLHVRSCLFQDCLLIAEFAKALLQSSSLSWRIFYHVHTDTCSRPLPEHRILLLQGLIAVCVSGTWVLCLFPVFLLFWPLNSQSMTGLMKYPFSAGIRPRLPVFYPCYISVSSSKLKAIQVGQRPRV